LNRVVSRRLEHVYFKVCGDFPVRTLLVANVSVACPGCYHLGVKYLESHPY
jgi:hypothetical protein